MINNSSRRLCNPERYWSLDVFRGVCALAVFLTHWHLWSYFVPHGALEHFIHYCGESAYGYFVTLFWPTGGQHPAVIGFFVLSGFCIHYPYEFRLAGGERPNWPAYYRRRFWRIVPVYWVASLLGLAFAVLESRHPSGSPLLQFHALYTPGDIMLRMTGLHGLFPHEITAGNFTLGTVPLEMIMYALYPAIYYLAARKRWGSLTLFFGAAYLSTLVLLKCGLSPFWVFNSALMFGVFWYMGAVTAHLFVNGRLVAHKRWLILSWIGFLVLKSLPRFYGQTLLKQLAWGLVCALVILVALSLEERMKKPPSGFIARMLLYLGNLSYSLYAVHTPAIMLASWLLLVWAGQMNYLLQLATTLGFTSVATLLVHHTVEKRFYPRRV